MQYDPNRPSPVASPTLLGPETAPGLYLEFDRADWARLGNGSGDAPAGPAPPDSAEVERLRGLAGLGDPIDAGEIRDVYLPLIRLLAAYVRAAHALRDEVAGLLAVRSGSPFVIGIAGGVAVGKSTVARLIQTLLARDPATPRVDLVTTDGFLLPNAELIRRGLLARKGFPESYDRRALLRFLARVKAGEPTVPAPVYSHLSYDVLPGTEVVVDRPDVLIVEGINVLQPPRPGADGRARLAVVDFFDCSIYVDARLEDVRRWYVERFLALRRTAFADPASYFHRYAALDDTEAVAEARRIFRQINEVNLVENILPTRGRATLILQKGPDHAVERVFVRRP
jgi:type I pantothenate kinase